MNADRLLEHYERIADAPDAVARLRRFVLDLAARGKLVPQDASDKPTSDVGVKIKNRRRGQVQESIEPPFVLPAGWMWRAIGSLADQVTDGEHATPPRIAEAQVPLVTAKNVREGFMDYSQTDWVSLETAEKAWGRCRPQVGDLLLVCVGATTGRLTVLREPKDMVLVRSVALIRPNSDVLNEYLERAIRSSFVQQQIWASVKAAAQPCLYINRIQSLLVPLPPLTEQQRIVAKVDELIGLCDQLEAARQTRETTRDRLAAASLARLNEPDPETFPTDARLALNALPALTARPDQIKALRQTILNLAVCGKLVPQDANEEPISATLHRAMTRRAALVKAKKVRTKKLDGFSDLEAEADLPSSWVLERLGNLVDPENTISYGVLVPGEEVPDGIPFIRAQDLALSGHPERPNKTIAPEVEKAYSRTRLRGGEILVCVVGSIGKLGIVPQSWAGANIARAVARILPIPEISREYLLVVLRGDPVQTYFNETTRTLAQPTLNVGLIEQTPIPIPPLAEQHRIVAKVDALMALCDRLEASLAATSATRSRLLDALMAESLSPNIEHRSNHVDVESTEQLKRAHPGGIDNKTRTAVVLAFAYERHLSAHRDKTFGHVKAQKILHLVEAETDLDLGRVPVRDAAGPNDFQHMLAVEEWALNNQYFSFDKTENGYKFRPLAKFKQLTQIAGQIDPKTISRIERIIDLFVPMDTEKAELFATVYAAWNNLLAESKNPTDDDIIRASREDWHPSKTKIPRDKFLRALEDLRRTSYTPKGLGRVVRAPDQTKLFS